MACREHAFPPRFAGELEGAGDAPWPPPRPPRTGSRTARRSRSGNGTARLKGRGAFHHRGPTNVFTEFDLIRFDPGRPSKSVLPQGRGITWRRPTGDPPGTIVRQFLQSPCRGRKDLTCEPESPAAPAVALVGRNAPRGSGVAAGPGCAAMPRRAASSGPVRKCTRPAGARREQCLAAPAGPRRDRIDRPLAARRPSPSAPRLRGSWRASSELPSGRRCRVRPRLG